MHKTLYSATPCSFNMTLDKNICNVSLSLGFLWSQRWQQFVSSTHTRTHTHTQQTNKFCNASKISRMLDLTVLKQDLLSKKIVAASPLTTKDISGTL